MPLRVEVSSPMHETARPPGDWGQPPSLQTPDASTPFLHSQRVLKLMHQRSLVKGDVAQTPSGQSAFPRHGSHVFPTPWQEPKRCPHVGTPSSSSKFPHSLALPHGQDRTPGSHNLVQIFSPLPSFAQT
jgi:hypothetical protein